LRRVGGALRAAGLSPVSTLFTHRSDAHTPEVPSGVDMPARKRAWPTESRLHEV